MGQRLSLPESRAMPAIGARCHELRVRDVGHEWRIVLCVEPDAIVILEVFSKKTAKTPRPVIEACRRRLSSYRRATKRDGPKEER